MNTILQLLTSHPIPSNFPPPNFKFTNLLHHTLLTT